MSKLTTSIMSLDDTSKQLIELCNLFIADYEKFTCTRYYGNESLFRYQLTRIRLQEFLKDEYKTKNIPLTDINK